MSRFRSIPVWVAILGSGFAGILVALQSQVNGALSKEIGNGYLTSAISFGSGLVILLVVLLVSPAGRRGVGRLRGRLLSRHLPRWALTGGACGAFFVLGQGLVAPVIGLALFTVGIVGGQVAGGLIIDRLGVGPSGVVRPSMQRLVGTALVVVAVGIAVTANLGGARGVAPALWLVIIPIAAGVGVSWQSAVNGVVRTAAQSAMAATLVNFVVGAAVLVLIGGVSVGVEGWPQHWPSAPWYYVGGFVGTIFIGLAALLVRTTGVLLLSMSNVAGQLLASIVFEAGVPLAGGVTPGLLAGTAVAFLAVLIAAVPQRA